MTIKEATELVIQAGSLSKGGDVFLLDMGEPLNILELAKEMIKLSGKSIKIKIIHSAILKLNSQDYVMEKNSMKNY